MQMYLQYSQLLCILPINIIMRYSIYIVPIITDNSPSLYALYTFATVFCIFLYLCIFYCILVFFCFLNKVTESSSKPKMLN
jgi:hypothetical protein